MFLSRDNVTAAPGWATVTVAVCTGVPVVVVNVTVAGRASTVAFAVAVKVTVPFPDPVVGDTVNHDWFDVTCHAWLEVTATVVYAPADDGRFHVFLSTFRVGTPGWVTSIVAVATVSPTVVVNVTTAGRDVVAVLAAAVSVTEVFPDPVVGEIVTQA